MIFLGIEKPNNFINKETMVKLKTSNTIEADGEKISLKDMAYGIFESARELLEENQVDSLEEAIDQAIEDTDSDMSIMIQWSEAQKEVIKEICLKMKL